MKTLRLFLLALALSFPAAPALAQFKVVASCGTLSPTLPASSAGGVFTVDQNGQLCVANAPFPAGSTPLVNAATGTTGAVSASLAGAVGKTTYICGFDVSAIGGTATIGPVTISNLVGSKTFTYQIASTASGNNLTRTFSPCIPASATNTAIAVATTADGTATAVDVNVFGYQF